MHATHSNHTICAAQQQRKTAAVNAIDNRLQPKKRKKNDEEKTKYSAAATVPRAIMEKELCFRTPVATVSINGMHRDQQRALKQWTTRIRIPMERTAQQNENETNNRSMSSSSNISDMRPRKTRDNMQ